MLWQTEREAPHVDVCMRAMTAAVIRAAMWGSEESAPTLTKRYCVCDTTVQKSLDRVATAHGSQTL